MKKAAVFLGFLFSFEAAAQTYGYAGAQNMPVYGAAAGYGAFGAMPSGYPAAYPAQFYPPAAPRFVRRNPYAGGIGMNAYGNPVKKHAIAPMAVSAPLVSVVPQPQAPVFVPARAAAQAEAQQPVQGEDTAFFKQYIKDHPEVMPDVKLEGDYKW